MKKCLSLILVVMMVFSMGLLPVKAEEGLKNAICTIENENGYLAPSGSDRGNALTVGDTFNWRFKEFLGGSYSFVGENDLAADVNSASAKEGTTIIQWTATGANNQRWTLEEAEDGLVYIKSVFSGLYLTEAEGVVTQEAKNEELNQLWKVSVTGKYEPQVEKMLESDAAKSLTKYRYQRLYDYIMSGGEFNLLVYDKIEKLIAEKDYFNLSMEEQVAFVEECFTVVSTDLMYGSMATKLQRDIEVKFVGIEENVWQDWHGIPEEEARRYDVTITDKETGDSHTFKYYSTLDNDEEYAKVVGEAVACFEMPIAKTLHRFIYTSMNTSSWNGGDNTIWNNTGYRGDVNNMVQMFAHELGHVMDNGRQDNNVWYRAIAQDMVPVTGYGNTNRWEDLAEYSRLYLLARGDELRVSAIENTYPARAKAYKALLYAVDNAFYADYKDEYEEVVNAIGTWDESVYVTIGLDGKYMKDVDGEIVFADMSNAAKDWYTWEIYTQSVGQSVVKNKATGRYLGVNNGALSLGDRENIGLKKTAAGYSLIDAATGFAIDKNLNITVDDKADFEITVTGKVPFAGEHGLKLHVTGELLSFVEGEGLMLGDKENAWTFVPVDKDCYLIMDKKTGKVFDISGGSMANGASAILYSVTGGNNQHFKLVNNGNGTYKLQLVHSNLYLTVTDEGLCQSDGSLGYVNWVIE